MGPKRGGGHCCSLCPVPGPVLVGTFLSVISFEPHENSRSLKLSLFYGQGRKIWTGQMMCLKPTVECAWQRSLVFTPIFRSSLPVCRACYRVLECGQERCTPLHGWIPQAVLHTLLLLWLAAKDSNVAGSRDKRIFESHYLVESWSSLGVATCYFYVYLLLVAEVRSLLCLTPRSYFKEGLEHTTPWTHGGTFEATGPEYDTGPLCPV